MTDASTGSHERRPGAETRAAAQRVALELFTRQGYEATSLRQIATELGINKASLYYHFASKSDIVASLFDRRESEVDELLAWLAAQPLRPDLVERAILRWVDTYSVEKLQGIRFLAANPLIGRTVGVGPREGADEETGEGAGERIGAGLRRFAEALGDRVDGGATERLLVRMAILSINAAVVAAAGSGIADEDIVAAARRAARALVREVVSAGATDR